MRELLHKRIRDAYLHPQFQTDVMKPLSIEVLMDQQVCRLAVHAVARHRRGGVAPFQLARSGIGLVSRSICWVSVLGFFLLLARPLSIEVVMDQQKCAPWQCMQCVATVEGQRSRRGRKDPACQIRCWIRHLGQLPAIIPCLILRSTPIQR